MFRIKLTSRIYLLSILMLVSCNVLANSTFSITKAVGYHWPTSIYPNQTIHAYYTITNNTNSTRENYTIIGLPPTVNQNNNNPNHCSNPITLTASASCTLQLDISGRAITNFALCKNENCSTAAVSLNVQLTTSAKPTYAYVAGRNNGDIYQCSVNSDGSFDICNATAAINLELWQPSFITMATVNNTEYAYIHSQNSGDTVKCLVNSDGSLSNCDVLTFTGSATSITFASFADTQYAYVANGIAGQVEQCTLNGDGTFNTCSITPTDASLTGTPTTITIANINNSMHAYVTEWTTSPPFYFVYACNIDSNGNFYGCATTPTVGAPAWSPRTATVTTIEGTSYAYVTSANFFWGDPDIYRCTINDDGTFDSCNSVTGQPIWQPLMLTFKTINGIQYAYVAVRGGQVYQCSLHTDGNFNTCSTIPASPQWTNPEWIYL